MTIIQSKIVLKKILEYSVLDRKFDSLVYFINKVLHLICKDWVCLLPDLIHSVNVYDLYQLKVVLFWIFHRSFKCRFNFSFYYLVTFNTSLLFYQIKKKQFNTRFSVDSITIKYSNGIDASNIVLRNIGILSLISPFINSLECNLDDNHVLMIEYLKNLFQSSHLITTNSNSDEYSLSLDRLDLSVYKIRERNPFIQIPSKKCNINTLVYRFDHELDLNVTQQEQEEEEEQQNKRINQFLKFNVKRLKLLQSNKSQKVVCRIHNIVGLLDLTSPITYLYLERITISQQSLIELLVHNQYITTLKLYDMDIVEVEDKGRPLDAIISTLSNDKVILHLSLSIRCHLVDPFYYLISKNSCLKSLSLRVLNKVRDRDYVSINPPAPPSPKDTFIAQSRLESMTIDYFNINTAGLMISTRVLDRLDRLEIYHRDHSFTQTIIPILEDPRCRLTTLTITSTDPQDWNHLFLTIKSKQTITHLSLIQAINIPVTSYATLLLDNHKLHTLEIRDSQYQYGTALDPLLSAINDNTSLRRLKIEEVHRDQYKTLDFFIGLLGSRHHRLETLTFNCTLPPPNTYSQALLVESIQHGSLSLKNIHSHTFPPFIRTLILSSFK
ncbi:hypothetical protein CYY_005522 [Polysphondylium violaceum]|uniref:Uncharacterized protein n=1 Tax=Polysphondylium violaceum TaxID=133409 RepID=A0A8J4V6S6_9MYCE|nr:hypothetical protein CYY_005522 [Polysphondylium violaceum]